MIQWLWEGNHIKDEEVPENAVGFIYMILLGKFFRKDLV
jgi:hypothetical protein